MMDEIKKYQDVIGSQMSEKLDGIQGIWDGQTMRTRTGNVVYCPAWWAADLPRKPLKGELWIGRGRFDETLFIVTSKKADDRWVSVKYIVFDEIPQVEIKSAGDLDKFYKKVLKSGGEGVVITLPNGKQVKKVPWSTDDGKVVGYKKGTQNAGLVGSLVIQLRNNKRFDLAGLDNKLKKNPPKLGRIVQFYHRGRTSTGLPRFASYCGLRAEKTLAF